MSATIDHPVRLHAVADDPAVAMRARRCDHRDRALEAVERMRLAVHRDLERALVIVAAHVANRQPNLPRLTAAQCRNSRARSRVSDPTAAAYVLRDSAAPLPPCRARIHAPNFSDCRRS